MKHVPFAFFYVLLPADVVGLQVDEGLRNLHARGKIVQAGWAIWYLFGSDENGEYLDYYASHRMTDDRHVRIYAHGSTQDLPVISGGRICSEDPEEDARLGREHLTENQRIAKMLEEKGFGISGDEPGGVQIIRYFRMNES